MATTQLTTTLADLPDELHRLARRIGERPVQVAVDCTGTLPTVYVTWPNTDGPLPDDPGPDPIRVRLSHELDTAWAEARRFEQDALNAAHDNDRLTRLLDAERAAWQSELERRQGVIAELEQLLAAVTAARDAAAHQLADAMHRLALAEGTAA